MSDARPRSRLPPAPRERRPCGFSTRRPRSAATREVSHARSGSSGSTARPSRCFRTRSVTTSTWYSGRDGDGVVRRYVNRARLLVAHVRGRRRALQLRRAALPDPAGSQRADRRIARALALRDLPLLRPARQADRRHVSGRRRAAGDRRRAAGRRRAGALHARARRGPPSHDRRLRPVRRRDLLPESRSCRRAARSAPRSCHTRASIPTNGQASPKPSDCSHRSSYTHLRSVASRAPSHVRGRGCSSLQAEGVPLALRAPAGRRAAAAVRSALERSAIVVDQLNAGWYGGFAVEAMALGKPVVAALDLREHPVSPTRAPARSARGRRLRRDAGRSTEAASHLGRRAAAPRRGGTVVRRALARPAQGRADGDRGVPALARVCRAP